MFHAWDFKPKFLAEKISYEPLSNLVFLSFISSPQWFVPAAGQRRADLPPLLWGHPGLAVSQRGPAPQPVTPPALCGGGAGRQQLGPHHGLRQALGAVPRGPAVPGEGRGPGAPGGGPPGVLPAAEGTLLQPSSRGEGGSLPAGDTSSGHQQEDRILPLWAERGLDRSAVAGLQPHQQWRWVTERMKAAMLVRVLETFTCINGNKGELIKNFWPVLKLKGALWNQKQKTRPACLFTYGKISTSEFV